MDGNTATALGIGAFLAVAGVLGFVDALAPGGELLGMFAVSPLHNVVHIATGAALLAGAVASAGRHARAGLLALGGVYALVTVLGFIAAGPLARLGLRIDTADNFLHLALTVALLGAPLAFKAGAALPSRIA